MKFIKILPLFLCSVFLFGFASSYKTEANSEPIRLPKEYYVARLDFKKKDLPPGVEVKTQIFNYTGEVWYTLVNKSKTPFYLIGNRKLKEDDHSSSPQDSYPNSEISIDNRPLYKLVSSSVYFYSLNRLNFKKSGWMSYSGIESSGQWISEPLLQDMGISLGSYGSSSTFFVDGSYLYSSTALPDQKIILTGYFKDKKFNIPVKLKYIPWVSKEQINQ